MKIIAFLVLAFGSLGVAAFLAVDTIAALREGIGLSISDIMEPLLFVVAAVICVAIAYYSRTPVRKGDYND